MPKVITFGNFKGGTGKTTNACMVGMSLAKKGYKTLVVDLDPQADATALYLNTKRKLTNQVVKIGTTLMSAISNGNLRPILTNIRKNLYLLPSFEDFASFPLFLEKKFPNSLYDRSTYLSKLLKPIINNFDFVILDTPPTVSLYTDSALMASDYVVIVLQTQERSFMGAEAYINYLRELKHNYRAKFEIAGILPVLLKNRSQVDHLILSETKKTFGTNNVFNIVVKNRERLKRYDVTGIQEKDFHDRRVFQLYSNITNEFLKRVGD